MNIGDKVVFKNENLSGVITAIYSNDLVGVTIEDDFELKVHASEVIVTESLVKKTESPAAAAKVTAEKEVKAEPGVYLHFQHDGLNHFQLSVYNSQDHPLLFSLYAVRNTGTELLGADRVPPMHMKETARLSAPNPEKWGTLNITLIHARNLPARVPVAEVTTMKFRQADFLDAAGYRNNRPYYLFRVLPDAEKTAAAVAVSEPAPVVTGSAPVPAKPEEVIDLHWEKLFPGTQPASADEATRLQMQEFQRNLELAIAWRMNQITFIHGMGSGVLRNLIRLALKGNKQVLRAEDGPEHLYGSGGATRIVLKS